MKFYRIMLVDRSTLAKGRWLDPLNYSLLHLATTITTVRLVRANRIGGLADRATKSSRSDEREKAAEF